MSRAPLPDLFIDHTCTFSRTAHKLYLLSFITKYLTQNAAFDVFKAMVLPYIAYPLFLSRIVSDKLLTKLQHLQNRGLRICLKAPARTPVSHMHQDCKLLYFRNQFLNVCTDLFTVKTMLMLKKDLLLLVVQ